VTNTQVTLVQIDNYGPWTVTPEPRREPDLQTLQSRLYADLAQLVGNRGGCVFFARFDNMLAVTNGLTVEDHAMIQESIGNRYPVTVSFSIAAADTPGEALSTATEQLQRAGSAQDDGRREILRGEPIPERERADGDVEIAHFDVDDATEKYTDELHAFDTFVHIESGYLSLMRYLHEEEESLAFFVGGDNVIAVCAGLSAEEYVDAVAHVEEEAGVRLKVGVGRDRDARAAGMAAKYALETCREDGSRVEGAPAIVEGD
jgi:GTP cyclohydrolase IIa